MYDKLAFRLICDEQMLIEIFEFVPKQPAHISAPGAYPKSNLFDREDLLHKGFFHHTHKYVHDWCSGDFFRAVKKFTADIDEQTLVVLDEVMVGGGFEVLMAGL